MKSTCEHEINLRGAPYDLVKTLLEHMTDVISEGSGEHVCLHNLLKKKIIPFNLQFSYKYQEI